MTQRHRPISRGMNRFHPVGAYMNELGLAREETQTIAQASSNQRRGTVAIKERRPSYSTKPSLLYPIVHLAARARASI